MIDFTETYPVRGSRGMVARIDAHGALPADMYYIINVFPDGRVESRSRANGNGSIRYYRHRSYNEAMAHGIAWAKRKIAEQRRGKRGF